MNKAKRWADKHGERLASVTFDADGSLRVELADERGTRDQWMNRLEETEKP